MIIATAGHVDHGKTSLLHALTGVDADTLPEEKRRGMTIDLGYAYLPLIDGSNLGFIDVPGHEKFLANMLAGIGGIQHALLVVACDDGIMPQTEEHLTILYLLNIQCITVALTKADCVTPERVEELTATLKNLLASYKLNNVTLFATSTVSGQGIAELRQHLISLKTPITKEKNAFRLAIDRAFTIKGSGLVVTGTALGGSINTGDSLWLTGCDKPVRVRGLHAQNIPTTTARAGQRIALNIAGDTDKQQITRGDWLLATKPMQTSERVIVAISGQSTIHHWQSVHLYHAASHITGRVSLLEDSSDNQTIRLAELILDKPLYLAERDILIIRDIGAKETLGRAEVLEIQPPKKGKRRQEYLDKLYALANSQSAEAILAIRLANGAVSLSQFCWAHQLPREDVETLLVARSCIIKGDIALSLDYVNKFKEIILHTLAEYHQQHNDQPGVNRSRLKRMSLPTENDELIFLLIEQLIEEKSITNTRGWLHLPEYGLTFTPEQQAIWSQIQGLFSSEPLWVREIAEQAKLDENLVRQTLCKAAQLGLVVAIVKDRYYLSQQIYQFADLIRTLHKKNTGISAATFRDQLGIGRKLAVQILEFFDKVGFTRRKGNEHVIKDCHIFLQ